MAIEKAPGFCECCNQLETIQRNKTNHWLHFILTIATFGGWGIIWIIAGLKSENWRCTKCGNFISKEDRELEETEEITNVFFYLKEIELKLLAKMSVADGVGCFMEKEYLNEVINNIIIDFEEDIKKDGQFDKNELKKNLIQIFVDAQNSDENFEELLNQIIELFNGAEPEAYLEINQELFGTLKKMAYADGELSIEEEKLLKMTHKKLKLQGQFNLQEK